MRAERGKTFLGFFMRYFFHFIFSIILFIPIQSSIAQFHLVFVLTFLTSEIFFEIL